MYILEGTRYWSWSLVELLDDISVWGWPLVVERLVMFLFVEPRGLGNAVGVASLGGVLASAAVKLYYCLMPLILPVLVLGCAFGLCCGFTDACAGVVLCPSAWCTCMCCCQVTLLPYASDSAYTSVGVCNCPCCDFADA
ncbi:hypothetical protein U1Q18_017239 [Sarracenia purpurea var. burkii]